MITYPTDRVPGDIPERVADLKPGDHLRSFSGLFDTVILEKIESQYIQGGTRVYHLTYSDGTQTRYVSGDELRYLAVGPAREPNA